MTRTLSTRMFRRAAAGLTLGLVALLSASSAFAYRQDTGVARESEKKYGDVVSVFSGDIRIPAHVDRRGMIVSIGGDVVVEGRVQEVVVIMGSLEIRGGNVRGQVVGVLSELELVDATIGDQLINVLGSLDRSGDTLVDGQTVNISFGNWFPGLNSLIFWGRLFLGFLSFVALLLLATLVPERIRVIGDAAGERYVAAFFVGILGYLGAAVIFSLLLATVIGIPVAIFGFYAFKWLGIAGVFYAIGRRVGHGLGRDMSLLGAILITFAAYVVLRLLPAPLGVIGLLISTCIWALFFLLIEIPAVGLVILTRLGTYDGRRLTPAPPTPYGAPGPADGPPPHDPPSPASPNPPAPPAPAPAPAAPPAAAAEPAAAPPEPPPAPPAPKPEREG